MRPETPSQYRPQLDGLRAICILFTVANHIDGMPIWVNGKIGVDIFFALSGWLITTLLLQEAARGRIDLRAFYIRRFFRIAPLYFLTILLYGLAVVVTGAVENRSDFEHALFWLATFNSEYRPLAGGNIFGHAWTLGIEEKFYLIWPVILFALVSRPRVALIALLLCSAALMGLGGDGDARIFFLRGYLGLCAGATVALLAHRRVTVAEWLKTRSAAVIGCAVVAASYIALVILQNDMLMLGISGGGAVLVGALWHNDNQPLARRLAWGPLAWAGRLTYGMYLIHILVMNVILRMFAVARIETVPFVSFLATYFVSLVAAYLLYRMVEKPLIGAGRRLSVQRKEAVAA
jgi:peptidoglycan/LPS O-acetylase OafA/YrhL